MLIVVACTFDPSTGGGKGGMRGGGEDGAEQVNLCELEAWMVLEF